MLTRANEGSKKSVRKVVQDFVHQQYDSPRQVVFGHVWNIHLLKEPGTNHHVFPRSI